MPTFGWTSTGPGMTRAWHFLKHAEAVADCIIVTYELEQEFKKNRQSVQRISHRRIVLFSGAGSRARNVGGHVFELIDGWGSHA
jgi:hypothetical protein